MNQEVKVVQLCLTLYDPMNYTVHGILQARILRWVVFLFSRGSSQPRNWTQVSHIASWTTREAQEYWSGQPVPSLADLPNPGIKLGSAALQVDSLPTELLGNQEGCLLNEDSDSVDLGEAWDSALKKFFFNWSIVNIQCCINFYCIAK